MIALAVVPTDRIPTEELKLEIETQLADIQERVPTDRIPTEELKQRGIIRYMNSTVYVPTDRIPTEELKRSYPLPNILN